MSGFKLDSENFKITDARIEHSNRAIAELSRIHALIASEKKIGKLKKNRIIIERYRVFLKQNNLEFSYVNDPVIPLPRLNQPNGFKDEVNFSLYKIGEFTEIRKIRLDHLKMGNGIIPILKIDGYRADRLLNIPQAIKFRNLVENFVASHPQGTYNPNDLEAFYDGMIFGITPDRYREIKAFANPPVHNIIVFNVLRQICTTSHLIPVINQILYLVSDSQKTQFYRAARDANGIYDLIKNSPALIEFRYSGFRTSLHLAAARGNLNAVRTLLEQGANPNQRDEHMLAPIDYAVKKGAYRVVNLLLRYNSRLNTEYFKRTNFLETAIKKKDINLVKAILETLIELKDLANGSHRLIELAITKGSSKIVKMLIDKGAKLQLHKADICTIILSAKHQKRHRVIKAFIAAGLDLYTVLLYAVDMPNLGIIDILFAYDEDMKYLGDKDGNNILHSAILSHKIIVIRHLLANKYNVESTCSFNQTALHKAVQAQDFLIACLLVGFGANPMAQDSAGKTPLFYAVLSGNLPILYVLLESIPPLPRVPMSFFSSLVTEAKKYENKKIVELLETKLVTEYKISLPSAFKFKSSTSLAYQHI